MPPKRPAARHKVLTRLPSQFKDVELPFKVRGEDRVRVPLWTKRLSHETNRQSILKYLASHCYAPDACARRHLLFLDDQSTTEQPCWTLRSVAGSILERSGPGGAYTWIWLGDFEVGFSARGRNRRLCERVGIDAHRLVCWLVHGAEPNSKSVVMHRCDNKRCVRPGHLQWGTQSANVSSASAQKAAKQQDRRGAL